MDWVRRSCGADGLFGGSYPTRAGGGWEASLPWAARAGEVRGGTRGDAWGPGFITKGRRYYIGTGRYYEGDAL